MIPNTAMLYQEINGEFLQTQWIPMSNEFETPCQAVDQYVTMYSDMNNGIVAVLELFINGNLGYLAIFGK